MRMSMLFLAVVAILGSCIAVAVGVSEESNAALGTFTGGANQSSPSNPYTGVNCAIGSLEDSWLLEELEWTVYYVELGSSLKITGMSTSNEYHSVPGGPEESWDGEWGDFTLSLTGGVWNGGEVRGFFTGQGQVVFGTDEEYGVVFEVVCNNDTKVQTISAGTSGVSTFGLHTDGTANSEKSIMISTKPSSSASPAPTTTVRISQLSGYDVVQWRQGISASGVTPYLYVTPMEVGTAEFLIEATDGGGASTVLTVNINEYRTATLTFDANGGQGAPADMEDESYSGTFYFYMPEDKPTRSGYDFLGWAESPDATVPEYDYEDVYNDRFRTTSTTNVLYAVWQKATQTFTATLSYDSNGGSGAPSAQTASIEAVSATGSKTFTVSSGEPTRSGFVFRGWALSSGASSASYHGGDSIAVSYGSSVTLYAVWDAAAITITGTPATHGIVGTTWSYKPVIDTTGHSLEVSGASWLTVSDGKVIGTPDTPGTYTVTLTATKTGYQSGTQTFTVTILSSLSFQSSPTGGAIIYAV